MLFLPLPIFIFEVASFVLIAKHFGFLNALGAYLLPSLLGVFIVNFASRWSLARLQKDLLVGGNPGKGGLHAAAIFVAGLLLIVPSLLTRILGVALLLPGFRHLLIWKFKNLVLNQVGKSNFFKFGNINGASGFQYYHYTSGGNRSGDFRNEREVRDAQVLDVTPLEISHENLSKKSGDESPT